MSFRRNARCSVDYWRQKEEGESTGLDYHFDCLTDGSQVYQASEVEEVVVDPWERRPHRFRR